ncbi:unnamed protein product [Chrysoparadoxa australica]
MQPPFARTPPPNRKIIVNHDLVWEDGVVAETILDFDAPHVSVGKAALMWLGGFGFFASIYAAVTLWDPESHRQVRPCCSSLTLSLSVWKAVLSLRCIRSFITHLGARPRVTYNRTERSTSSPHA